MRRKRCMLAVALWLAGFIATGYGVWSFQGGELMLIVYLALTTIAYIVYAFSSRCPNCRRPVLLRPRKVLGAELFTWSLLPPAACRHCGNALN